MLTKCALFSTSSFPGWPLGRLIILRTCAGSYPFHTLFRPPVSLLNVPYSLPYCYDFCSLQSVTASPSPPQYTYLLSFVSFPSSSHLFHPFSSPLSHSLSLHLSGLCSISTGTLWTCSPFFILPCLFSSWHTNFSPKRWSVIAPYVGCVITVLEDHLWSC